MVTEAAAAFAGFDIAPLDAAALDELEFCFVLVATAVEELDFCAFAFPIGEADVTLLAIIIDKIIEDIKKSLFIVTAKNN